ncbi:MAG: hypothetical protein OHK93_005452 [Ramalina farinacea]|uniref:Uncharacterized protein n=1 Tax=Ramalina farinacea TaxID=258253 RepID=A0AA43TP69_9LECA|nr:hypothetical protein [Ramalina farinacea]
MSTPSNQTQPPPPPIPPSFHSSPKTTADGKHTFHKAPTREEFDRQWREAVARGEDPRQNLVAKIDSTKTSSFVEYWWRKGRGKKATKAEEQLAQERKRGEREEGGEAGLLEGEPEEENEEAVVGGATGSGAMGGAEKAKKAKWHDRLRWGL